MKNTLLILYFSIVSLCALAQDTISIRTFGGPYNDYGNDLIETSDGGYAIIGTTGSYWQNQSNMYLLKLNSALEKEWSKVFGGENVEWGQSIVETDDGYLLLGYTNSYGAGGYDIYLVKCDFNGEFIWQKTYGGADWDFGYTILAYDDGYYIAGESWSFSNGGSDGYLLNIDLNGNLLWSEHFGGNSNDAFYDLIDGHNGIVAVGYRTDEIAKTYLTEVLSDYTYNEYVLGYELEPTIGKAGILHSNGNYYITGEHFTEDTWDYLLIRLDSSFEPLAINNNALGGSGNDFATSIIEVSSGSITMTGESDSFTASIGAMMLRVSEFGNFQAAPTHGAGMTEVGRALIINSNQQMMMVGETNSYGEGSFDIYLLQFSDDIVDQEYTVNEIFHADSLLTTLSPNKSELVDKVLVFPNPVSDNKLFVRYGYNWNSASFFNLKGQLIERFLLEPSQHFINIQNLSKGTYILELQNQQENRRQKIIVH